MTRRAALAAVILLVLGIQKLSAHDGHTHTVMGTVTERQEHHLQVATTNGKTVTITLNEKTKVLRDKQVLTAAAILVGQRVVVDVGNGKEPLVARQVKLGAVQKTNRQ